MFKEYRKLSYTLLLIGGLIVSTAFGAFAGAYQSVRPQVAAADSTANDSVRLHFPVRKTSMEDAGEAGRQQPLDLRNPENIKETVEYDHVSGLYIFHTKIGDQEIATPFSMNSEEYMDYTERAVMNSYFKDKNREIFENGSEKEFNFLDMQFGIGAADKIFGPGGVQIKTQGTAEISFGLKNNKIDNPTLSARARNKTIFDFDEQIQLNVNAKVGDKMSFDMNYNTKSTFNYDAQKLKLAYAGKEDEIIKSLEAGNVSMTTGSSLIKGGAALFGVKTQLQFGKLNVTALLAQQESTSQTVNSKGGAQTRSFDFSAAEYDENRHYFLSHYFRDNYDKNISKLPYISSGVEITKMEVWVTNKRGNYDQARNIVAFMDLGESSRIGNDHWIGQGGQQNPYNRANTLHQEIVNEYPDARDITKVTSALSTLSAYGVDGGKDYEKVESARLMASSEYTLNTKLGYLSLKSKLNSDEVLAVAFEYTLNGQTYQVGEFASNSESSTNTLYLKLLKGTSVYTALPIWDLMMKNVYALNAYQIQKEKFRLDVQYMNDTTGVYLNYIQAGNIRDQLLIKVLGLDRLNSRNETVPDGYFDYVDGYTIIPSTGRVIFPSVEPFGEYLANKIGDPLLAARYCYTELYDSTRTVALQAAEKNKFRIKGEYKASSGSEINLNAMNVPRGSVTVTAGGVTLTENTDYTVDYTMGIVTILNQSILESGTSISVSLENQNNYSVQRKTLVGLDLQYEFSKNFTMGGTVMHLSEKPLTNKVSIDDIPLKNTIYGFNLSYKTEFMWLTNLMGSIPWVNATAPSTFSLTTEYAQLIAGHSDAIKKNGEVYLDDFESSQTGTDLRSPYLWQISSTPYDQSGDALFPEASLSNDVRYGYNRALLNWYYIDRLFTQRNSSLTPSHIKSDLDQLSNHYVREVNYSEIYPNKELTYGESGILTVLNLSYYPTERGPYNLDADNIDDMGNLLNPEGRWGGMMRKIDVTDFETANIEYIQFWMMDPFVYDSIGSDLGGDLYFNLGEVSEDILKDGMKAFENGLPVDDNDDTYLKNTVWGRMSTRTSTVYAFDNSSGARQKQDVGFNGLSTSGEFEFPSYKTFVENVTAKLSAEGMAKLQTDPFSPLNDPGGDNYHYYRGGDYDAQGASILERYKRVNGLEGNSGTSEDSSESYSTSAKTTPDVEDINLDNTLNEYERYYQYKISIRPKDLVVGHNFVTDKKSAKVKLRNGKEEYVNWYQFKVPLSEYEKSVGAISDFKSIRFMRIFLTKFNKETHMRFASMDLMRGDWRKYNKDLYKQGVVPISSGQIDVAVVNIEENAGTYPVNYVLPPGVTRVVDPGQSQVTQLNEQAMSLKVSNLSPSDARAVYKNITYDMRRFKRLQLFSHAHALVDDATNLHSNEMSVFIRLGSDYKDNYYEYEIPLRLTPAGEYSNNSYSGRVAVWPEENMFDFPLSLLTDIKLERNNEKRKNYSQVTFQTPYSIYDPDKTSNKVTIVGNPSLSDVNTIMIGVRNNSKSVKAAEVWVNELRLTDFNDEGGWAARANMNLGVSDIATVNFGGQIETAGFGSVDQGLTQRRLDDYYQYNVATTIEVGKLLPEQAKLTAPVYYSYSKEVTSPEYDPYNQDILLSESLKNAASRHERDSIKEVSQEVSEVKSFSLSGMKVGIQSKNPMPWDPANITASYSFTKVEKTDPTLEYEHNYDHKGSIGYSYSPYIKPWAPFARVRSKSPHLKIFKDFSLQWLPNNISLYSGLSRSYTEQQLRSIDESGQSDFTMPVTYSSDFRWDRQTSVSWNVFKSLRLNFSAATNAKIDEADVPVNQRLYPDEYEIWRDSVKQSLLNMGTPLDYNQSFDMSYTLPLNKLPWLNWATSSVKYNSSYAWNKGVYIDEDTELGNSINNQGQWQGDLRLNMETLYNKSKFLKETNKKFSTRTASSSKKPVTKRKFNQRIKLKPDTTVLIRHNLDNKNIQVTAKNTKNEPFSVKYVVKDKNSIVITTRGEDALQLSIVQGKRPEEETWYKVAQYGARGLMSVRSVTLNYKRSTSTYLPSFNQNIGDFLGQGNADQVMTPGVGFAFGFDGGESYVDKAIEKGWVIVNDSLTTPASISRIEDFQFRVSLEPLRGLKIDLSGSRVHNQSNQHQFMFQDLPMKRSGSFTMTTVAIRTSLKGANAGNNYQSDAFDSFLDYRSKIAARLDARYQNPDQPAQYASYGTSHKLNSADVMIPAFIAAYTGRDPDKTSLNAFPSLREMLPNWRVTYDGLSKIPLIAKYFRTFTLSHAYRCTYSVGSFSSFTNWFESQDGLGYVTDAITGEVMPSSEFDIQSVTMTESYAPLIGLDMALKNGITGKIEYKDTRNLTLNMSSVQIVEAVTRDITIGSGYKIANFNKLIGFGSAAKDNVNHDLTLRGDLTFRNQSALLRKIEEGYTQATSGTKTMTIKITADYAFSRLLTVRGYYDKQINTPLVSSTSYPVSSANYGITFKLSLTR